MTITGIVYMALFLVVFVGMVVGAIKYYNHCEKEINERGNNADD